jgi:ribonuclease BN (tRNA processing enzyme)
MSDALTLLTLGTGDAFSKDRYSTALLVEYGQRRLLIDSPHPIRKMLCEADPGLDVGHVDGLVLTHLHGDHASGVEGLAFAFHFGLRRRLPLLAHAGVAGPLWPTKLESSMAILLGPDRSPQPPKGFADYFDHVELTEGAPVSFGPFTVEVHPTVHHIPTWAVRISAGGATLAYSADTAFDQGLFDWLCAADLVVHETNLGPAHTPYATLCALPEPVRAKMRLVAWPDGLRPEGGPVAPLRVGERIAVGPTR